jgi:hypothetical protein
MAISIAPNVPVSHRVRLPWQSVELLVLADEVID